MSCKYLEASIADGPERGVQELLDVVPGCLAEEAVVPAPSAAGIAPSAEASDEVGAPEDSAPWLEAAD